MKRHVFLTRRPQTLPTLNAAFPGASVLPYPPSGAQLVSPP